MLIPLMRELGVVEEENQRYRITEQGEYVLKKAKENVR